MSYAPHSSHRRRRRRKLQHQVHDCASFALIIIFPFVTVNFGPAFFSILHQVLAPWSRWCRPPLRLSRQRRDPPLPPRQQLRCGTAAGSHSRRGQGGTCRRVVADGGLVEAFAGRIGTRRSEPANWTATGAWVRVIVLATSSTAKICRRWRSSSNQSILFLVFRAYLACSTMRPAWTYVHAKIGSHGTYCRPQ